MKRRKSNWSRMSGILLALSLCANLIFAILFMQLSRSTSQKMEVLEKKMEEFSMLMQERQDSEDNETGSGTENLTGNRSKDKAENLAENLAEDLAENLTEDLTEGEEAKISEKEKILEKEKISEKETENPEVQYFAGPMPEIAEKYISAREQNGEKWSVSFERLNTEDEPTAGGQKTEPQVIGAQDKVKQEIYEYNGQEKMQSASVIKVFIMGTVYDRMCYPSSADRLIYAEEAYEGELRYLLEQMITVSDNNAANRLIEMLGEGDFKKGAEAVNEFCRENGYNATSVGRRFLEENPSGDNYTSAADCRKILTDIYQGKCVGEEASGKMLDILKQQTNTVKIPSGLPAGTTTANKTGEMPEGYGLGCIENDMAIIYSENGDYVLTILSNELGGRNEEAKQTIRDISALVWEWMDKEKTE